MISKLHILAAYRNEITFLYKCYFTPPFKIANITENKQSGWLHLMIMNSSPGILDDDDNEIKIELNESSSLKLHTQSFQQLFRMKKGAKQPMEVHLSKDSSFIYLPHPSVPHEDSNFISMNKIYLSDGCKLIWGEVLTCGRKLNGEIFKFSKHWNITEVYLNNKIIIKENLLMQPSVIDPTSIGQLEGFTHQASLIYINAKLFDDILTESICNYLSSEKEILFGISSTVGNGIIIRILGHGAEQLHQQLKTIVSIMQQIKTTQSIQEVYAE